MLGALLPSPQERTAAALIQSAGRGWQARRRVAAMREERRAAAAAAEARRVAAQQQEERTRRLVELQLRYEREHAQRQHAAVVIQTWVRGVLARAAVRQLRQVWRRATKHARHLELWQDAPVNPAFPSLGPFHHLPKGTG